MAASCMKELTKGLPYKLWQVFFYGGNHLKKLNSLRSQFMAVLVGLTVLLVVIMGAMNIIAVTNYSSRLANMELNWQAQRTAYQIQKLLIKTADITHATSNVLKIHAPTADQLTDPDSREKVKNTLQHRFRDFASHTPGIAGYYVHFSEKLVGHPDGFHYIYDISQDKFLPITGTTFAREDMLIAHGLDAWYQLAKDKKEALWIPPHPSEETGLSVVSYIEPVYIDDQFVGVIGIDIQLDTLVDMLQEYTADGYKGSKIFLFSNNGLIYYHPDYPRGAKTTLKDLGLEHYAQNLREKDSADRVFPFTYAGEEDQLAFVNLENGINLGITAPNKEIYRDRNMTIFRIVLLLILLVLLTTGLALLLSSQIVSPLKRISDAAKRVGDGDYDTPMYLNRNDEIGSLADNIEITRKRLKRIVSRLRIDALQDKLTGLKNATAFQSRMIDLDTQIRKKEPPAFGLVMIDVNGLKTINDTYGHERGNLTLQAASQAIQAVYQHSSVYRIGGDEFCVIVEGDDLTNWDERWQNLQPCICSRNMKIAAPWSQTAVAAGRTRYNPQTDTSFSQVFNRADAKMYQNKRHIAGNTMR